MEVNYLKMIELQDAAITSLRKFWMNAPFGDKAHWMRQIDAMLDHRLELMAMRDA